MPKALRFNDHSSIYHYTQTDRFRRHGLIISWDKETCFIDTRHYLKYLIKLHWFTKLALQFTHAFIDWILIMFGRSWIRLLAAVLSEVYADFPVILSKCWGSILKQILHLLYTCLPIYNLYYTSSVELKKHCETNQNITNAEFVVFSSPPHLNAFCFLPSHCMYDWCKRQLSVLVKSIIDAM